MTAARLRQALPHAVMLAASLGVVGSFLLVVLFMRVADVETALTRAVALGGTIDRPRTPVPGIGSTVVLLDPDKNAIGLIGPAPRQR